MGFSVLFVDDDRSLLDGIKRVLTLERNDIIFEITDSADRALELLEQKSFDVIVSDQKMPGMKGLTLLSIVRSRYPDVKRIMLSAQVNEDVFREAESIADIYLSKPFNTSEIISEIEKLLKK